ncbi:MAG: NAD-dependent dihydropyrimidine dehydrogenase PreA subunit [Planctomycetota bacterium]|jgi:NAD-dependent dihydropyrimidine dehydrogenase PreA subunit
MSGKLKDGGPSAPLRLLVRENEEQGGMDDDARYELLATLLEAGHPFDRRRDATGLRGERPLAVLQDSSLNEVEGLPSIALDGATPTALLENIANLREQRSLPAPGAWTPWFPVIDYDRCTNCMQCLSFCLFDVYGADSEGKIEVRNEDNCKTNCPACSRVCPEVAILFPKYAKGPINGDKVREEDISKESMKVDITALLGGDIYSSLKSRSEDARKRFSTERDESKALLERKRCLKALGKELDIPDEVLMSLPSAGEIEERARRAHEKMERRRAVSQTVKDQAQVQEKRTQEWDL